MPEDGSSPSGGWRAVYGEMEVSTSAEEAPDLRSLLDGRRPQDAGTDANADSKAEADTMTTGRERRARADD